MARLEEGRVVCTPVSGHHVSRCRVVEESEGSMSAGGHVFVLLRFRKWGWECGSREFLHSQAGRTQQVAKSSFQGV